MVSGRPHREQISTDLHIDKAAAIVKQCERTILTRTPDRQVGPIVVKLPDTEGDRLACRQYLAPQNRVTRILVILEDRRPIGSYVMDTIRVPGERRNGRHKVGKGKVPDLQGAVVGPDLPSPIYVVPIRQLAQ